jgi:hypothetical protein
VKRIAQFIVLARNGEINGSGNLGSFVGLCIDLIKNAKQIKSLGRLYDSFCRSI